VPAENKAPADDNVPRFTQELQVHVVLLVALAGVLVKFALSAELNRSER
jgi:hypothetical protein